MPLIVTFKENYEAGAKLVNPDVEVLATYHPGGFDVAFMDPDWGAATAADAISQGADVVFGAGGATGNGALIETAKYDDTYCIGVDYDVWESLPEARNCLVSSEYRLITPAVYELIELAIGGEFPGGEYLGQVGLGPFHDFEGLISPEIIAKLLEVQLDFKDGTIEEAYP
jgi:basic membrane protein A